eukprot:scaffold7656_cov121-Isochrysis_galbana.AAC.3
MLGHRSGSQFTVYNKVAIHLSGSGASGIPARPGRPPHTQHCRLSLSPIVPGDKFKFQGSTTLNFSAGSWSSASAPSR